ncbi:MAG: bifunctional hydroxymethylpyrimidine kinase/phosphomethylpyrimidine kinase [Trueperaceae bacterium]|nr:bifunctional hydroxymethylpyrimidine kinase/phosphomethylpyrimidine kinase [Trueperaceae bacterium]
MPDSPKKILTVGGWDPCGTYGVAADIKTFATLGCHGMAALSVATVQNSQNWLGADFFSADFVADQLEAILSDYGTDALKTGFLGQEEIIGVVAEKIKKYGISRVIVDPVVLNGSGEVMFKAGVKEAYETYLFPLATVVTPNLSELSYFLTGETLPWTLSDASKKNLAAYYQAHFPYRKQQLITLKGVRNPQPEITFADGWFDGQSFSFTAKEALNSSNLGGSGDTFSAAITAYLAITGELEPSIKAASQFTHKAIQNATNWKLAHGQGPTANFLSG